MTSRINFDLPATGLAFFWQMEVACRPVLLDIVKAIDTERAYPYGSGTVEKEIPKW
jgi:hypothetical protein